MGCPTLELNLFFNPSYHGNADTRKNLQSQTLGSQTFLPYISPYLFILTDMKYNIITKIDGINVAR